MGGIALVTAFLLSIAPGVVSRLAGVGWGLDGIPWTPMALLPWLALAGCPRARAPETSPLAVVALLLPALALALASDVAAGNDRAALFALAAWGGLVCAALAVAAGRGGTLHAAAWWLAVPAAALLFVARTFVGDLPAADGLGAALGVSPLVWPLSTLDVLRATPGAGLPVPFGPLAVAALLIVAGGRGRAARQDREPGTP